MKMKLAALILAVIVASVSQVWATVLPDACGTDNVKFKVSTQKGQPVPSGPTADKAQIVIVESPEMDAKCLGPSCHVTVRIGLDGAWIGATEDKSYFAFSVGPGEHHLCANWQSALGSLNKLVNMTSFIAESGTVYYYEVKPVMRFRGEHQDDEYKLDLKTLDEDEGNYAIKVSSLSASTPKR
jgi:hypothetical protein